ncbi:MAG: hypothetical protein ACR2IE_07735 [Candidatus Sumerlaeaceae bacterium]
MTDNSNDKHDSNMGPVLEEHSESHARTRARGQPIIWVFVLGLISCGIAYDLRPYWAKELRHAQTQKLLPIGTSASDTTTRLVDGGYRVPVTLSSVTTGTNTLVRQYRQTSVIGFLGSCMGMWPIFRPGYEDIWFDSSGHVVRIIFCD